MKFQFWQNYENTALYRAAESSAYFYVSDYVAIDADGSPRAYRPDDKGLDALANAGYPHKGWRSVLAVDPADPSTPFVQPSGSNAGCFVSKTSLHDATRAPTDPTAYVNAETIPYLVFPGAFYVLAGTGAFGDLVMARNLDSGDVSAAIVADGVQRRRRSGKFRLRSRSHLAVTIPIPAMAPAHPRGIFNM